MTFFHRSAPNNQILEIMKACQTAIHHWGAMSRVSFDPSKEELAILDPRDGSGDDFKMLGPTIDKQLLMKACIDKALQQGQTKGKTNFESSTFLFHIRFDNAIQGTCLGHH